MSASKKEEKRDSKGRILKKKKCIKCGNIFEAPAGGRNSCCLRTKESKTRPKIKEAHSRHLIYKRDGYLCYYCGIHLFNVNSSQITLDHVYPQYLGGRHTASNLVTSCLACNNKKQATIDVDRINETLEDVNRRNETFGIPSNKKINTTSS